VVWGESNGQLKMPSERNQKINSCMRGFLIFVNVLFMLFGLGIVFAGSYLLASKWADIDPDLMKKVGGGLIGVGLVTLFLACAGCVGAWKKIKCLLVSYIVFVFIVMAACAGLSYVLFVSEGALQKISDGQDSGSSEFEEVSNTLQVHFDAIWCAAAKSNAAEATKDKFKVWTEFVDTHCNTTGLVADNVCSDNNECNTKTDCAYQRCKTEIASTILEYITPVAAGVAGFAGLQLLLIIASCMICCYNRAQTLEEKYDGKGTFVEFY